MLEKELERRRKRYEFALVHWYESEAWGEACYAIERKDNLKDWIEGEEYKIVCDTEPSYVLRAMKKLLKES
jgi:hypothetical protein